MTTTTAERRDRLNRRLTILLYRIAAIVLFSLGVDCWIRLVGIHDGVLWRFDLMPVAWKIGCATLAVLGPVAGVGLWMTVSWGAVTWVIVAMVEGVMHVGFPDIFGGVTPWLAFHVVGLSLLAILKSLAWAENRRLLRRASRE